MRYAIIAAGEGSRLAKEGIDVPKPLVELHGETLIDRLVRIFCDNGAEEIIVISRQPIPIHHPDTVSVRQLVRETPSSMHSFFEISQYLKGNPFVLTTVDTIFREGEFKDYISSFRKALSNGFDGMMGVTDFIDDEKPLFVKGNDIIEGFLDNDSLHECHFISGGIYGLTPDSIDILCDCIQRGQSRMRNFQRALVKAGMKLRMYPFSKILDIDHVADIVKSERFLNGRIIGIYRAKEFSPNCIGKDRKILSEVVARLCNRGYDCECVEEDEIIKIGKLPPADFYLSMARTPLVLSMLEGRMTLNKPEGTALCNDRRRLISFMEQLNIPIPKHMTIPTEPEIKNGVWIKKAVGTTISPNDTVYCASKRDFTNAVDNFYRREKTDYIVESHERGDLIKFYGIAPTLYFHTMYPTQEARTKFGLEAINGKPRYYVYDKKRLQNHVTRLANAIGVKVYGGDAIVHSDGTFSIIDFNDWPSFSSVVDEAADMISSIVAL